jgi:limonene-1,2-epoxide hydrolase
MNQNQQDELVERCRAAIMEKFARVRQADPRVADLFTEDAVVKNPGDVVISGREAIRAHYQRVFDALQPQPEVVHIFADHPEYFVDLNVRTNRGPEPSRTIDIFRFDDDARATFMQVYSAR